MTETAELKAPAKPLEAFKAATGGILGTAGIDAGKIAVNLSSEGSRMQMVIDINSEYGISKKEIAIPIDEDVLSDPQIFSARIALQARKAPLVPPDDIWLYYGAASMLKAAEPEDDKAEEELARVRSYMTGEINTAAKKWHAREGDMIKLNSEIFTELGQTRYGIYAAGFERNIWTGKLSFTLTIGDKTSQRFLYMTAPPSCLENPRAFMFYLQRYLPVSADEFRQPLSETLGNKEWDLDEDEIPADKGWRRMSAAIRSFAGQPEDVDYHESPVGPAVEAFIRNQCEKPCFTLRESLSRWRPLWGAPDFRPAETEPYDYPSVIVFPQILEFYVDHMYNYRAPRSHVIELRHLIDLYLRIKYHDPTEELYGENIGFGKHPDLRVNVYMLPHPARIAWVNRENYPGGKGSLRSLFEETQKMSVLPRWSIPDGFPAEYLV